MLGGLPSRLWSQAFCGELNIKYPIHSLGFQLLLYQLLTWMSGGCNLLIWNSLLTHCFQEQRLKHTDHHAYNPRVPTLPLYFWTEACTWRRFCCSHSMVRQPPTHVCLNHPKFPGRSPASCFSIPNGLTFASPSIGFCNKRFFLLRMI